MIAVVIRANTYNQCLQTAAESALGRGNRAGAARVDLDRLTQRACQPLEAAFDDVVVVLAVEVFDVQGHTGRLREGLEPFLEKFGVHFAKLRSREIDPPDKIGPVRDIDTDAGQCLVERDHRRAVTLDAGAVTERHCYGRADDIAGVLGRVVKSDMQIAFRLQSAVYEA